MEMVQPLTGIESVVEALKRIEMQSGMTFSKNDQIHNLQLEFRFLKMFSLCLANSQEAGNHIDLSSVLTNMEDLIKEAGQGLNEIKNEDLDLVAGDLLEKVEHFKLETREICASLFACSLKCKSRKSDEILEFMDSVIKNLKVFMEWIDGIDVPVKSQIRVLEEKLSILRNLIDFVAGRCIDDQKLEDLLDYVNDWVNKAACLSLLYWLDGKDERMFARLETMLSNLLQKIRPYNPKVTWIFVRALNDSNSSPVGLDKLLIGQIVVSLVDLLLEELRNPLKDDYVEILREGLIFLMTFTMDPPVEFVREAGNRLFTQTNMVIKEVISLICSLYIDDIKDDISIEMKVSLSGLQHKIGKVKAEVKEHYVQIPDSSFINFPTTNGIGFLDFFLGNLEEMLKCKDSEILFAKDKVVRVQEQLLSLRPFLKDIMELQNENEQLQKFSKRIFTVVYQAEHAINLCLATQYPIWYDMLWLTNVVEDIKLLGIEVKKINDQLNNISIPGGKLNISQVRANEANTSRLDDVVVGLKDESDTIIDRLKRGTKQLDIVLIVGMPGLGKTTLAKKVYNDPSVKYYFNRCAWCCVSRVYKSRELLLDILTDLNGVNARLSNSNTKDEDLAEQLWKALKGRKYLIVIDDIWEIGAWNSIKQSLPDDNNGSRVVFTSRIHNLVSQGNLKSIPHPLRPLSDEESWELLQEKLFHKNGCPPDLIEIGKSIVKNCKGVPLAVVLVAGVLAKTKNNMNWWKQIEESTGSQIASEGCMDVLELSYKHLPDSLRSCFLYFGAFPEDRVIRVRKLINLWIAEGLIQRTDHGKSLYDIAEDYLFDLIGRSLVIVAERSSKGGIKACRVHDLLRNLCLAKIQEDKFLEWVHEHDVHHGSLNPKSYEKYRLCIDSEWTKFTSLRPTGLYVHSLLLFGNYGPHQRHPNPSNFFKSFKLLNVLDLECIYFDCSFPEEITLIVHLRYLALWCCTKSLPSSIVNLWNLETLIVRGSAFHISLPETIWKMKSLRHVNIPSISLSCIESDESCMLYNIDTFSTPILNSGRDTLVLLTRLPRLRKLNCNFLEYPFNYEAYKFPELSCLNGLESLKVYSYGLVFYGPKRDQFPAFSFPITLRRLTLGRFTLPWSVISVIGQLPNLEVLKLQERAFSGKRWEVEDGEFLNLKYLQLWRLNIEEWRVSSDPFPSLERVVVRDCYSLKEIPSSLGDIPTLKKIEVRWCFDASSSARQILEEQQDMGNDGLEVLVFD